MARVASCPQCEHDLIVPDDADPSALIKCPQCRGFFELQHAPSRELPAALIVESHAPSASGSTDLSKLPTVDDFSTLATIKGDAEPITEEELKGGADVLEFAPEETVEFVTNDPNDFSNEEPLTLAHEEPIAELPRIADEAGEYKVPGTESHEEAAQRIDQWFRSAKTLSDLPPLEPGDLAGNTSAELVEPMPATETHPIVPVDFGGGESMTFGEHSQDLEMVSPSDAPASDGPAWDDSQHMDRLLADLESQPADTFEPSASDEIPLADEPHDVHETHEQQEAFHPTTDWKPDEALTASATVGKPEKQRSIARTLVFSAVGGVLGLALGYYALLWLGPVLGRGKDIDFLQIANYLPKGMLPAAFRTETKKTVAVPPAKMLADLGASEKDSTAKSEQPPAPVEPAPPVAKSEKPAPPAEKQATFTAPAEPAKKPADTDDRYAIPAAKNEPAMREPAPLDAPPAKSITENAPKAESVRIANGPSFTGADVTAALQAAGSAEAGLIAGNLQDGKEVAHTKGVSYMSIADFAQKATFADPADATKAQHESDEFFRKLLSNPHARDEVAQIVPRWMSHPRRPQNGVFLAGSASHGEPKGSVVEYNVELPGGPKVVVVVPAADGKPLDASTKAVGVVGAIIDKPADEIRGYTGSAPQVVFAKKLLPLE